jgi:hypothetical protein
LGKIFISNKLYVKAGQKNHYYFLAKFSSKADELLDETEKHIFHAIQESERLQLEWIRREHRPEDREADCNANRQRRAAKRKYGL